MLRAISFVVGVSGLRPLVFLPQLLLIGLLGLHFVWKDGTAFGHHQVQCLLIEGCNVYPVACLFPSALQTLHKPETVSIGIVCFVHTCDHGGQLK